MAEAATSRAATGGLTDEELNAKYPNRPYNHASPLPFRDLVFELLKPLDENKRKASGPPQPWRRRLHGHEPTPHEQRRLIIERFIIRWRKDVGPDVFPFFRLILPDKDRERAMYGLKERAIAKLLVRIVKIDKNSPDALNLLNWKLPGQTNTGVTTSGDFAARCQQVLAKRQLRHKPGDMDIDEVNRLLDKLSLAQKEDAQLPIFETFYHHMSAEELMWLVRIILRQTKVGATEKTIFDIYHPNADLLFNVSSNLRRVCWELHDPNIRLEAEETDVNLMQCFQPQLAQFQSHTFEKMVQRLRPTDDDKEFWIEEKLDGERMQLHMCQDSNAPGGVRFSFWSRKAKDYTYLYGSCLKDDNSALTKHLGAAFHHGVRNIILDGEMITYNTVLDRVMPFGTLKTAALAAKSEADPDERPVLKVFDILFLNDKVLTNYTLRDRRRALEQSITPVSRRLEIHTYTPATSVSAIEPALREIVAESSEGVVLKNPRSAYRLNSRNDDWVKVKPEYMSEYGEALDCVIVGGYYGSGRRGGTLSSFMCGLLVEDTQVATGARKDKCWSFFKVGGGFAKTDYDQIHQQLDGKWRKYDKANPPTEYLELGGGAKQFEAPDVWIPARDSVVIAVKAASVHRTPQFRTNLTLRFPRFKALRLDRSWDSALSVQGFAALKDKVSEEHESKAFEIEQSRKKRKRLPDRKGTRIAGAIGEGDMAAKIAALSSDENDPTRNLFAGFAFLILSDCIEPRRFKRPKADVEAFVKAHGGKITQRMPRPEIEEENATIPVSDKDVVKLHTLKAKGKGVHSVIRPRWLFECVEQARYDALHYPENDAPRFLLPYEPGQVKYVAERDGQMVGSAVDAFGDSWCRNVVDTEEMRTLLEGVPKGEGVDEGEAAEEFVRELEGRGVDWRDLKGWMFKDCRAYFDQGGRLDADAMDIDAGPGSGPLSVDLEIARNTLRFAGGKVADDWREDGVTHVVLSERTQPPRTKEWRSVLAGEKKQGALPRIVTTHWINESWKEGTRLDEEKFAPV
ncbi:MAG: hypothetical protein Q9159_005709 [Coniocarpon cinnabarinum]